MKIRATIRLLVEILLQSYFHHKGNYEDTCSAPTQVLFLSLRQMPGNLFRSYSSLISITMGTIPLLVQILLQSHFVIRGSIRLHDKILLKSYFLSLRQIAGYLFRSYHSLISINKGRLPIISSNLWI